MTAPPGSFSSQAGLATLTPTPVHDQGARFEAARVRRDYPALQAAIRDLSKRDAVAHLHQLLPHRSERWYSRNLDALVRLDPDHFWRALHADPTGEAAVRNAA